MYRCLNTSEMVEIFDHCRQESGGQQVSEKSPACMVLCCSRFQFLFVYSESGCMIVFTSAPALLLSAGSWLPASAEVFRCSSSDKMSDRCWTGGNLHNWSSRRAGLTIHFAIDTNLETLPLDFVTLQSTVPTFLLKSDEQLILFFFGTNVTDLQNIWWQVAEAEADMMPGIAALNQARPITVPLIHNMALPLC